VGVLDRFERRVEALVEGAFARAFRSHVEPVEIAAALEREVDDKALIVDRGRRLVPNQFTVELSQADHERLGEYDDVLGRELATAVKEHADEHGYSFVGSVEVAFVRSDELETGTFRVTSKAVAGEHHPAAHRGPRLRAENTGVDYPLTGITVVGRGAEAGKRLDDPGVSRRHAQIQVTGGDVEIRDLGSTNGTLVNGRAIDARLLHRGDRVEIGSTVLVYSDDGVA
jgi:hypothetical protein